MSRWILGWGPATVWAALLFVLSGLPDLAGPGRLPFGDKAAHFGVYLILGSALAWGRHFAHPRLRHGVPLVAGAAFALSDEWHQSFVPGRDPSAADLGADLMGLALGYGLATRLLTRRAPD